MAKISPGTMTAAIFAILVGLAGAYTVRHYLHQEVVEAEPEAPPAETPIMVPIASRDLVVGQEITLDDIVLNTFTREQFAKTKFAGMMFMPNTDQIIGRSVKVAMKAGAVFVPDSLFPASMGPGIAEMLKPGFRAVTVPIENIGAVQGFARAGSFVDVLFRAVIRDEMPEVTVTLIEGVEVLALGQTVVQGAIAKTDNSKKEQGSVTLAVTPEQAKALKVAENRGELSLTLRNPEEVVGLQPVSTASRSMTLEEVLGIPYQRRSTMEIYRGGQKEVVKFGYPDDPLRNTLQSFVSSPVAANGRAKTPRSDAVTQVGRTTAADAAAND